MRVFSEPRSPVSLDRSPRTPARKETAVFSLLGTRTTELSWSPARSRPGATFLPAGALSCLRVGRSGVPAVERSFAFPGGLAREEDGHAGLRLRDGKRRARHRRR